MDEEVTLIRVATVNDQTSAEVVLGRLHADGLEAVTAQHSDVAIRPAAGSLGIIDIMVPESHVAKARQIIGEGTDSVVPRQDD